ncbi:MAG: PH domain-containing protein, partial [Candidatus Thermoplasmatota archaeon]|nr:PH domain-containing protein [Candidatus Thermoplasmatota archaeon]
LLGIFIEDVPDTPRWLDWYYLVLGISSAGSAAILTLLYQRAFMYAITDRRIHIRKQFLYFHSSIHGISFADIENLKATPSIIGRLLGFGDVYLVTASGMGLAPQPSEPRISSRLFGWFFLQRNRTTPLNDPEGCLYGIKDPMSIYQLINELMDTSIGPAGSLAPSFDGD